MIFSSYTADIYIVAYKQTQNIELYNPLFHI